MFYKATKSGKFAFSGIWVKPVKEGELYDGTEGQELHACGWAKPTKEKPKSEDEKVAEELAKLEAMNKKTKK